jgi:twinkle protein
MNTEEIAKNIIVTIFKDVKDVKNPHPIGIGTILERIKTGKSTKGIIEELTMAVKREDVISQKDLKEKLPVICFAGTFEHRANKGIKKHSGLICLDFDHLGENLEFFRKKVEKDKYTFCCFLSPRRDGLKVVVKIPPEINNHALYFEGLRLHFKENKLDDDSDIARACFESYDPNIFINYKSAIFDIKVQPKVQIPLNVGYTEEKIVDPQTIFNNLKKWSEKNSEYIDGNKYRFLVSLTSACNRFGLPQEFVEQRLIEVFQQKASFVKSDDFVDIVNRIYISYSNQFGISFFSEQGEMNDFDPTGPARDVIYLNNIRTEMWNSFHSGDAKGETTYFKTIDDHWSWKRGEICLMGGIGNHGKTTLMLQLMLIKSVKEGAKWGIFSPEQNPPIDFYKDLIHTYIGKSTEKFHSNRMSEDEYKRGMDFIGAHFFFIYPKDDSPTPSYINERFGELIVKHGIIGCITDPFNQLDNDYGKNGRDDIYISNFLSKEKRFALNNNVYKILIAHPRGSLMKTKEGNYECPDVYDLAGGAMWNNKMDNILATYRPFYTTEKKNTEVQFRSQKIKKQKLIGIPGNTPLHFDIATNRYLELGGIDKYGNLTGISPFDETYEVYYPKLREEYDKKMIAQEAATRNRKRTDEGFMDDINRVSSNTPDMKAIDKDKERVDIENLTNIREKKIEEERKTVQLEPEINEASEYYADNEEESNWISDSDNID